LGISNKKAEMIGGPLAQAFEVAGPKGRGRSRKTWGECVRQDLQSLNLKAEWAQDRTKWKGLFGVNRPTRASVENGR